MFRAFDPWYIQVHYQLSCSTSTSKRFAQDYGSFCMALWIRPRPSICSARQSYRWRAAAGVPIYFIFIKTLSRYSGEMIAFHDVLIPIKMNYMSTSNSIKMKLNSVKKIKKLSMRLERDHIGNGATFTCLEGQISRL